MAALVQVKTKLNWPHSTNGRFERSFNKAANDAAKFAAKDYVQELKDRISIAVGRNAKGRVIKRSKPGQPPRRETAELWKSISIDQIRKSMLTRIYTTTIYAAALEFGDLNFRRYIAPRPAWMPTFLFMYRSMIRSILSYLTAFVNNYRP